MIVDTNNVPKPSILEKLNMQIMQYRSQKDQAEVNLQQLIGALYASEQMIKKIEECDKAEDLESVEILEKIKS